MAYVAKYYWLVYHFQPFLLILPNDRSYSLDNISQLNHFTRWQILNVDMIQAIFFSLVLICVKITKTILDVTSKMWAWKVLVFKLEKLVFYASIIISNIVLKYSHNTSNSFSTHRQCTIWPTSHASVTESPARAAWKPVGSSWRTSAVWESSWKRSTTALPPCASADEASWSWSTTALTPRRAMTWSTSTPARTTACVTRPPALWAPRAVCATRPRRAWTAASSCAAVAVTTSSRPTNTSAATASSTGAATSSVSAARRS